MKCPKCQFENREEAKFCNECGSKLEPLCPSCGKSNSSGSKFCDECGQDLRTHPDPTSLRKRESHQEDAKPQIEEDQTCLPIEGERKHVTVLFSDMSGYTAMSEKLDPEEVKEITSRVFGEIAQVIAKYEGFIEKFIGDAVMAIFGATKAYEDNPIRAIKAGMEIHQLVESLSPEYEERIGKPLSMHTGINTGLVVTGEVNLEQGTHGIAGDTINLAARLSSLGNSGDILVGPDTYIQAEGYFDFETLEPRAIKGKEQPIQVYRVVSQKTQPRKIHRLQGVRARLIGRKVEMVQLKEAVEDLRNKKGSTFAICGTAGTGKSRLVEEFKETLDLKEIQWREGQAYPYAQNIPYFPLINLMNKAFQIEESDPSTVVRKKVEKGVAYLLGEENEAIPYVGSLYSLGYPEIDDVSPEFWKSKFQGAMQSILSALANRGPTVVCLEDLHWADPSFMKLIRLLLTDFRDPILFLCIYRPVITLLTSHQISAMANPYHEIRLRDLSPSESQDMIEGLLNTENVPSELHRFVREKVEGNPFYLEEVANSLIESKALVSSGGGWKVTRPITELDISSTIHGVIAARLDRLEKETKRILQEASVIGRTFFYEVLNRVTDLKKNIDGCLTGLERLDFIKARSLEPDLEYFFKHALTQEVVYNGLLKKERQTIHERIAVVVEEIFEDRLPEFYETLAFHFAKGKSVLKAVDYIIKSGEKSLKRYAIDESHSYFKKAFELISDVPEKSNEIQEVLVDLVNRWAMVYYYRGNFFGLEEILVSQAAISESIADKEKRGMFLAWQGCAAWMRGKTKDAYALLKKAKRAGMDSGSARVVAYACTWISWVCAELGFFREGIALGKEANNLSEQISDHYLFSKSLGGIGYNYFFMGDAGECPDIGKHLIDYGHAHSQIRCLVMGYTAVGQGHLGAGNVQSAIESFEKALEIAVDPMYLWYAKMHLCFALAQSEDMGEIETHTEDVVRFNADYGCDCMGPMADMVTGIILVDNGHLSKGMHKVRNALRVYSGRGVESVATIVEFIIGKIYLEMVKGNKSLSPLSLVRNIGFITRNAPFAAKRAEVHFNQTITRAGQLGAMGFAGQAHLGLGVLHKLKKRPQLARKHLEEAIRIFEDTGAYAFLKQAIDELDAMPLSPFVR